MNQTEHLALKLALNAEMVAYEIGRAPVRL